MRAHATVLAVIVLVGAGQLGTTRENAAASPPDGSSVAQEAKPVPFAIAREKGISLTSANEAVWDFGRRASAPGDKIEHVFLLRNTSKKAVTIDSLLTSCRCTTAVISRLGTSGKDDDPPFTLLPGKSVGVKVSIDVDQAHAVDFRKMVWVYITGRDDAVFTLTIAGTMTGAGTHSENH